MTNNWSFQREEAQRVEPGNHRVEIILAEETTSKTSGNPMIVVTVQPNGSNILIKNYIVKNEYFNRNMTSFFDSFNIEEGDFNFLSWVGAVGAANLVEDEKGFLKIKYFIDKKRAENLPGWKGELPERQTVTEIKDEELTVGANGAPW